MEAPENVQKFFGRRLKEARKLRGFTQESLAEELGLSKTTVYTMEAGDQFVSGEVFNKLISLLGQPPAFYFSSIPPVVYQSKPTPMEALEIVRDALSGKTKAHAEGSADSAERSDHISGSPKEEKLRREISELLKRADTHTLVLAKDVMESFLKGQAQRSVGRETSQKKSRSNSA